MSEIETQRPQLSIPEMVRQLLASIGENPSRLGLKKTPERFAKAFTELTAGYSMDLDTIINGAMYPLQGDAQLVVVRDIPFSSLCEHHLLPFNGVTHVAYIPKNRIIGLSKIPRIVQMYARRLQVQEHMTQQIADALERKLEPEGVGVIVEASHMCMEMRGIRSKGAKMATSVYRGKIRDCQATRSEFLALCKGS